MGYTLIHIDGAVVERVERFKFLCVHIKDLSWSKHSQEEGTTMPLPLQEAEKIWHVNSDPQSSVHLDCLQHHLVWQLLSI